MKLRRNKNAIKQSKTEKTTDTRAGSRKDAGNTRKGRGERARRTIRESPASPKMGEPTRTRSSGPPLRISGGKTKTVTGLTPEEVVRNLKGGKKR